MTPMRNRPRPPLRALVLAAAACTPGSGDTTDTGSTSAATSGATSGATTTDLPTTGVSTGDTGDTTGGAPVWPPPYVPTPTVTVTVDPGVVLGDGPCIYRCDPAVREELPPVMDLCELIGADGRGAGECMADCPAPQVCTADEFAFASAYCELGGLASAYCGAFPQQGDDHVVVVARLVHRLVGAQLILEFDPGDALPAVQVYLQEGWDEVDDMGNPYPIPLRLAPTAGTITLKAADFTPGATLAGTYELDFAWPDDPGVARTIRGHFAHPL